MLISVLRAGCERTDTHTQHTAAPWSGQLRRAGCSGHGHSPPCHVCPHQFVLVGSKVEGVSRAGVLWAPVPCAHTGIPELGTLSSNLVSVVQRWLFHSGRWGVLCGRGSSHLSLSVPGPRSSHISLGRQDICSGSRLCSFPRALSGSAAGTRGATPRALSAASIPWGNPSVWLRAVPIPTQQQQQKEVALFLEALKCLLC